MGTSTRGTFCILYRKGSPERCSLLTTFCVATILRGLPALMQELPASQEED